MWPWGPVKQWSGAKSLSIQSWSPEGLFSLWKGDQKSSSSEPEIGLGTEQVTRMGIRTQRGRTQPHLSVCEHGWGKLTLSLRVQVWIIMRITVAIYCAPTMFCIPHLILATTWWVRCYWCCYRKAEFLDLDNVEVRRLLPTAPAWGGFLQDSRGTFWR